MAPLSPVQPQAHPNGEDEDNISLEPPLETTRPAPDPQMDSLRGEGYQGIPTIELDGNSNIPGLHKEPSESAWSDISEWTVRDYGERLYTKSHPPESTQVLLHDRTLWSRLSLQNQLLKARCCIDHTNKGFFPKGVLEELINEEVVIKCLKAVIMENGLQPRQEDELELYAKKVCHTPLLDDTSPSFRKIFAILVLLDRPVSIFQFVDSGVTDTDLPLMIVPQEGTESLWYLCRELSPNEPLECFKKWSSGACLSFDEWQWTMLAPYFAKGKKRHVRFYPLPEKVVLPWTWKDDKPRDGGFGQVFHVKIHQNHHGYHDAKMTDGSFAIKKLKCEIGERSDAEEEFSAKQGFDKKGLSDARGEFEAEVEILRRFSGDTHPHLVSLLAAFQHGKDYYLLFHWAESDLLRFWTNISPGSALKIDNLEWMIRQCRGIADGLHRIHVYQLSNPPVGLSENASIQIYGRHGDIKPENFLLYKDKDNSNDRGDLKITDFGLAKFHSEQSRSNIRKSKIIATTPTYRPPECDMDDGKISRSFDIWSLGCVFLEFIAWYLGGWPYLKAFAQRRKAQDIYGFNSDQFFEIVIVKQMTAEGMREFVAARVKLEVVEAINEFHTHKDCSDIIHELLDFIHDFMLVVESPLNLERERGSSHEVRKKLDQLYKKLTNSSYKLIAAPREQRKLSIPEAVEADLHEDAKKSAMLRRKELREHKGTAIRMSQFRTNFSNRRTQSGM